LASANYALLLNLESETDRKSQERLHAEERESPALRKADQQAANAPSPHAWHAFCEQVMFFKRGADGLSMTQRWQGQGFPGLNNDERVVLEAKMRTRVALLEIHRILDGERIEGVDLLEATPRPLLFRDRKLALMAVRFSTALVWAYPLPHYWRLNGTAIPILEFGSFGAEEIVRETARHLGGPAAEMELRAWLAMNFVRVDESLQATAKMRRLQMFAGLDSQFGKAVYEWRAAFGACRDALDEIASVAPDSLNPDERDEGFADARVWMSEEHAAKVAGVPFVLGRVLLGQSHGRLECIGRERMGTLKRLFEKALGGRTRFVSERFDDVAPDLAEKERPPNQALIPPKLLQEPVKLVIGSSRLEMLKEGASPEEVEAEARARHYREFLEHPVPALDGQTPRQAAQNPAGRPKLIQLLKTWVRQHDEHNLRTGRRDDIDWLLRELGLVEIMFDAPPPRPRFPQDDEPAEEDEEDEEESRSDKLFPLPVLSPEPLSREEVSARLDAIYEESATAGEALKYLESCGSTFVEDAASLCDEVLEPEEFNQFAPSLIQARFALVPRGFREPVLDFERLVDAYGQSLDRLSREKEEAGPGSIRRLFENCRQPALAETLAQTFFQAFQDMPELQRPSLASQVIMMLTLTHMIDELDRSIRE
jgi:hypothetical protein